MAAGRQRWTGRFGELQQSLASILGEVSREECATFYATNAERVYRV